MAIVDKTHSQTIEEAFNSVAEGGSGGSTETVEFSFPDPMSGEFVCNKTCAELVAMQTAGTLPTYIMVQGQPFAVQWAIENDIAQANAYSFNVENIDNLDQGSMIVHVIRFTLTANGEQDLAHASASWSVTTE